VVNRHLEVFCSRLHQIAWNLDWPAGVVLFLSAINRYSAAGHAGAIVVVLPEAPFFYVFAPVRCACFIIRTLFFHHDTMTSFPTGYSGLGVDFRAPEHELRKHCPGCDGLIHVLCGRTLIEDGGRFKVDAVVCPKCDPQQKRVQPSVGLKSPRWALQPQAVEAFVSGRPF